MIKAAIFDMDGLLIDSEPIWQSVTVAAYKKLGIEITGKHHLKMRGRRTSDAVAYMYSQHPWEGPSVKEVEASITREVIAAVRREITLKPGVHQVLAVCKAAGLPVAIASSSVMEIIDAVVDTLEIREHFTHIYSAQFEPYGKPHPGVFLSVAEHFKVPPDTCLVFEDAPAGVLAAKAAGMVCVAVPDDDARDHAFVKTADLVLGSLKEFNADILFRL